MSGGSGLPACPPPAPAPHRPDRRRHSIRHATAEPSKGGRKVGDPTKSLVPDPTAVPSAEEFAKTGNFGVVTAWWVPCVWGL